MQVNIAGYLYKGDKSTEPFINDPAITDLMVDLGKGYQEFLKKRKSNKGEKYLKDYEKVLNNGSVGLYAFPDPNV